MEIEKQIVAFRRVKNCPKTLEEYIRQSLDSCLNLPSWDEESCHIYTKIWRARFLEERMKPIVEGPDVPF